MSNALIDTPGTLRPVLRLAGPVVAEQILHLLVELVDLWLTGQVLGGEDYIAAMTLMVYTLWLFGMLFGCFFYGASAMTARATGAADYELANRAANQAIAGGALWAVALMAIGIPCRDWYLDFMGLDGPAAAAASQYMLIVLCVLPCVMVEHVGISCLRGAGDTVSGLVVMSLVNIINMGLSYALAAGWGPFPKLGWTGIALGTAVGHVGGATLLLVLLSMGRARYHLRPSLMWPDWAILKRLLRVGIPGGLDALIVVCCQLTYVRVINSLGTTATAAHGVALQIEALSYMPAGAFQVAATTLTGQYLGAGDWRRARRSVLAAAGVACAIMGTMGVVFLTAARPLADIFVASGDAQVAELAARILHVIAIAMLPLAIMMVLAGALRGAGDTRWPMAITLIGMLLVRIPLATLFAKGDVTIPFTTLTIAGFGWGVVGAWCGAVIDIFVRCGLMIARFWQGGWRHAKV